MIVAAQRSPHLSVRWMVVLCAAVVMTAGCSSTKWVNLLSVPRNPLVEELGLTGSVQPTPRVMQLLRVYNLTEDLSGDPRVLLEKLQAVADREPSADKIYALSELAYLGGHRFQQLDPQRARSLYGSAVLHAYRYLFDPGFAAGRNPYDPEFRGACTLYNVSLEQSLRIELRDHRFAPGQTITIQTASGPCDITCRLRGGEWDPNEFDRFDFVSNYEITGLKNQYQSYGLGVPLIAVRKSYIGEAAAARYYPPNLSFPVTAFVRPLPADPASAAADGSVRRHADLDLYDPLTTDSIVTANTRVPLQSDLSTPLAYFLSDPTLNSWADDGLLRPDRLLNPRGGPLGQHQAVMGLYMVQPYQAGKIPVLFVHGLWSSPMTWMEMFNDLRSSPEIRSRYQFWFYLYPTTQPFWISAAQLRRDLAEVRRVLDPQHQEPALDQMVVIGHSMGGLVAKLQTVNSGDDFWRLASAWPLPGVKASPELRDQLRDTFYFQPNPSIRRVITIATPHRGCPSSKTTQWLLHKLISPVQMFVQEQQQLFRENPGAFAEGSLMKIENSVDSLEPSTPIFPVMLCNRSLPWLKCNNIVGLLPPHELFSRLAPGTDGVVSVESAHLDNAESELIVAAPHMTIHAHPLVVLEVRRILMAHLAALEAFPQSPPLQTAAQPTPVWK